MLDPATPPATRVRAADSVLEHTEKSIQLEDIEARLTELRARCRTDPARLAEALTLGRRETIGMNIERRLRALEKRDKPTRPGITVIRGALRATHFYGMGVIRPSGLAGATVAAKMVLYHSLLWSAGGEGLGHWPEMAATPQIDVIAIPLSGRVPSSRCYCPSRRRSGLHGRNPVRPFSERPTTRELPHAIRQK
jgi:hypothetical protein